MCAVDPKSGSMPKPVRRASMPVSGFGFPFQREYVGTWRAVCTGRCRKTWGATSSRLRAVHVDHSTTANMFSVQQSQPMAHCWRRLAALQRRFGSSRHRSDGTSSQWVVQDTTSCFLLVAIWSSPSPMMGMHAYGRLNMASAFTASNHLLRLDVYLFETRFSERLTPT